MDPICTGVLAAGQEARIVREDGSDCEFEETGELLLRGMYVINKD